MYLYKTLCFWYFCLKFDKNFLITLYKKTDNGKRKK